MWKTFKILKSRNMLIWNAMKWKLALRPGVLVWQLSDNCEMENWPQTTAYIQRTLSSRISHGVMPACCSNSSHGNRQTQAGILLSLKVLISNGFKFHKELHMTTTINGPSETRRHRTEHICDSQVFLDALVNCPPLLHLWSAEILMYSVHVARPPLLQLRPTSWGSRPQLCSHNTEVLWCGFQST